MKHLTKSTISALLLALLLPATGCVVDATGSEETRQTTQALGSTKSRVDISTWNQLVAMASDGNYRLTANINASGKTWTPKSFTGTFDGNGKTISNLTIPDTGLAGFFSDLNQAIVKNVKFTNISVSGWMAGGLAGIMNDSQVERVVVEGTIGSPNAFAVGGIFGEMLGGSLYRSYAKGTVQSAMYYAGGLAGFMGATTSSMATITQSYAQMTVTGDTNDPSRTTYAGGIAGYIAGGDIHDVYAVGNVTGRGKVGGLVGSANCSSDSSWPWLLYKGIYRGDVKDMSAPSGGWSGTVGAYAPCGARFANLFWDRTLDPSSNWLSNSEADIAQHRGTTTELRSPTTVIGGIYCMPDVVPGRCGDNNFETSVWDAGTDVQHHILLNMPGPNTQPR